MKKWIIYYGGMFSVIAVWIFFIMPAKILPDPWDLLIGLGVLVGWHYICRKNLGVK
jgi:hypothetical protein